MSAKERATGNQGIYPGNKCGVVGDPSQRNCGSPSKNREETKKQNHTHLIAGCAYSYPKTYCADKSRITDCTILLVTE
jgi:hypothetical protein